MHLQGNIPWTFGNLPIEILHLLNNMLLGVIPQSLTTNSSLYSLIYLNLLNNKSQGKKKNALKGLWHAKVGVLTCDNLVAITLKESSHPDCHT